MAPGRTRSHDATSRWTPTPTSRPSLQAVFDGAKCFGLTTEEIWQTFDQSLSAADDAAVAEWLDELAGGLARHILSKQRRIAAQGTAASRAGGREPLARRRLLR